MKLSEWQQVGVENRPALMSIDHGEIIRRLRSITGSADEGFRILCAKAHVCSNCMQEWDRNCDCACTKAAKS